MEDFLVSYTPTSTINIVTALYKRVETNKWTGDKEKEIKNFVKVLENALDIVSIDDEERLRVLHEFGTGNTLKSRVLKQIMVYSSEEVAPP
ncbi:7731_t:CDS:2 [Dentiscutata erythropus]|uniref:7731_t:CDS:1 n=1 Tax=Dentiscutata erythropus TaxID=1348616 RepID=A0A9N9JI03_9GLOM|nr:7731_t:CDS:2 [Dentiscutata erythropus]